LPFVLFSAPDLALTQLSVEVVTIVLLLLALHFLPQRHPQCLLSQPNHQRCIAGGVDRRCRGHHHVCAHHPTARRPSPGITSKTPKPWAGGTNIVNVILVDFRGFDTYGEISVLAIAAWESAYWLNACVRFSLWCTIPMGCAGRATSIR
jgi:multicomponent K+:H+ antiporter subunit A